MNPLKTTTVKEKFSVILFPILFVLMLASCQHRYPSSLVEADSLVYTNPKAALEKLDSFAVRMDTTEEADVMCLRLLRAMVKDKLNHPLSSVAEVCEIVDFFENSRDELLLAKSYYLMGKIARNMYEDAKALTYFHRVLECLEKREDIRLCSLVHSQIAYVYCKQDDLKNALRHFQDAYKYDSLRNDTVGMLYGLRDMAMSYDYMGEKRLALNKYRLSQGLLVGGINKGLKDEILLETADCYLDENLDSAQIYLMPFLKSPEKLTSNAAHLAYVYYDMVGKEDSAIYYLHHTLQLAEDIAVKYDSSIRLARYFKSVGRFVEAQEYYDLSLSLSDSLRIESQQEKEMKGKALFEYVYQTEQVGKLKKEKLQNLMWILFFAVLIVIISTVFFYYWQLEIVKKIRIQSKLREWKLKAITYPRRDDMGKEYIIATLGLNEYLLGEKHLTETVWNEMEHEIDSMFPSFKKNIYSCCVLPSHEYHICMLVKLGIGTSKIAVLTNRAPSTISTAKQRIYKKITCETGNAEQFDKLLSIL